MTHMTHEERVDRADRGKYSSERGEYYLTSESITYNHIGSSMMSPGRVIS
jgi:hypothetical protein